MRVADRQPPRPGSLRRCYTPRSTPMINSTSPTRCCLSCRREPAPRLAVIVVFACAMLWPIGAAAQITAVARPGATPAWDKGLIPINAESYYNAIECGKRGGDDPPCVFWDTGLCKNDDFTLAFYSGYKQVAFEVWTAVRKKQPAPQPSYQSAQRTRITVGVTPVQGSKNAFTDLVLKRGGKVVPNLGRSVSGGERPIYLRLSRLGPDKHCHARNGRQGQNDLLRHCAGGAPAVPLRRRVSMPSHILSTNGQTPRDRCDMLAPVGGYDRHTPTARQASAALGVAGPRRNRHRPGGDVRGRGPADVGELPPPDRLDPVRNTRQRRGLGRPAPPRLPESARGRGPTCGSAAGGWAPTRRSFRSGLSMWTRACSACGASMSITCSFMDSTSTSRHDKRASGQASDGAPSGGARPTPGDDQRSARRDSERPAERQRRRHRPRGC